MLEIIEFTDPEFDAQVISVILTKFAIEQKWLYPSCDWLKSIVNTPLNKQGLSLNELSKGQRLVEMEFYLPMEKISAWQINQILSEHLGTKVDDFNFNPVKGILKGYVDLIFVWNEQYFVLDYKSNHLGMSYQDYMGEQLEQAMTSHHYHLQYLLYSLALHSFLKLRLKNYDFEQHFGGNYYLFLRGMSQDNKHYEGVYFSRPTQALVNKLDHIFDAEIDDMRDQPKTPPQQLGLFGALS